MSKTCPACGAEMEVNAKFCTDCRGDLQSEHFTQPPGDAAGPTSGLYLPELTELVHNVIPSEPALGAELVVEVEANRPFLLNQVGLLQFRVTNNLRGPCSVAMGMMLQGNYVNQNLAEARQCREFHTRGDWRVFSFPFLATHAGDISVQELRLVLSRPENAEETVLYELPDRSLLIHVSNPALSAGSAGIAISGGIHIDFSQLKELYGADIKDILTLNANRGIDPAQAAIAWEPIRLCFSRLQGVESLPEKIRLTLPGGVSCELLRIRPGQFTMGSPDGHGKDDEWPMHPVRITRDLYLGKYPVTREQYQAVTGQTPARLASSPQHPVDNVSWEDAQQFCQRLHQHLMHEPAALACPWVTLDGVRLPTEAQWEYACRAGTDTAWHFGDDRNQIPDYGWCDKNSRHTTHPVGLLKPNAWGLCDMHGNLKEWCEDFYAPDYGQAREVAPTGPANGDRRVLRGGSWNFSANDCRSAARHTAPPDARTPNYGFRFVLLVTEAADGRSVQQRLLRQLSR